MSVIRDAGASNLGVILDVAHVHAGKGYPVPVIPKLGRLIKLVHFSDNDGTQAYHDTLGAGTIDFHAVLHSLKRAGFDGAIVVDISGVDKIVVETVKARGCFQRLIAEVA